MLRWGASGVVAGAVLLLSTSASADEQGNADKKLAIGVDGNLTAAVNAGNAPIGGGFAARAGMHYGTTTLFAIRPEAGGSYTRLLNDHIGRVFFGARAGVDFLLGVYGYGHGGYGWNGPRDGFTFDVGAAVDLRLFPLINPGVHLEYVNILDLREMVNAGVHVEILFSALM